MEPRIEWKMSGFRELRRVDALRQLLHDYAKVGARAAGDGYIARAGDRPTRARAAVITATYRARRDNLRNHTLLGHVIDAMRSHRP